MRDVEASSRWYQRLLGCESAHAGPSYERLIRSGNLVLQLHRWEFDVARKILNSKAMTTSIRATSYPL